MVACHPPDPGGVTPLAGGQTPSDLIVGEAVELSERAWPEGGEPTQLGTSGGGPTVGPRRAEPPHLTVFID